MPSTSTLGLLWSVSLLLPVNLKWDHLECNSLKTHAWSTKISPTKIYPFPIPATPAKASVKLQGLQSCLHSRDRPKSLNFVKCKGVSAAQRAHSSHVNTDATQRQGYGPAAACHPCGVILNRFSTFNMHTKNKTP